MAAALLAVVAADASQAQTPPLAVMTFPGGANLPLWVAEKKEFLARQGLSLNVQPAPNSVALARGLMNGSVDVALWAFDNIVAYQEGQGEVALDAAPDFFAFMAFSRGTLRLVVNPEIRTVADLKGRTLAVDALATGYSLVLIKILALGGLRDGDYRLEPVGGTGQRAQALMENRYAGTILTTPLDLLPEARGYRRLANAVEAFGPYQTIVAAARRAWAQDHRDRVIDFIRAGVAALDWLFDPANRAEAVAIYRQALPSVPAPMAERAVAALLDADEGLSPRGRLEHAAMMTVLRLRSELGRPARLLADPAPYVDERYYRDAIGPS
jgi:ABC-type nitrate/sulfonate/bicarbonate transport system substrate-binding protein